MSEISVARQIEETLKELHKSRREQPDFVRLRTFFDEMTTRGLVIKQEYDIPPPDTIGRSLYQTTKVRG